MLNQLIAFLSKLLVSLRWNYFPKRTSDALLHTLSQLCDVPAGFLFPFSFDAVYCYICGCRRVAVARNLIICLVHQRRILFFFKVRGQNSRLFSKYDYNLNMTVILGKNHTGFST